MGRFRRAYSFSFFFFFRLFVSTVPRPGGWSKRHARSGRLNLENLGFVEQRYVHICCGLDILNKRRVWSGDMIHTSIEYVCYLRLVLHRASIIAVGVAIRRATSLESTTRSRQERDGCSENRSIRRKNTEKQVGDHLATATAQQFQPPLLCCEA